MFDPDLWKEIISALKQNRLRSFMTAFGVFWGSLCSSSCLVQAGRWKMVFWRA